MRVNQPYDILKTYEGEELDWKGQLSHNPLLLSPNGVSCLTSTLALALQLYFRAQI